MQIEEPLLRTDVFMLQIGTLRSSKDKDMPPNIPCPHKSEAYFNQRDGIVLRMIVDK